MDNRIAKLQVAMRATGFDAVIIMQPRDLFYYSGTAQPCNLLVPAYGEAFLWVRRAMDFVRRESQLLNILEGSGFSEIKKKMDELGLAGGVLGVTEDVVPASIYKKMASVFSGFDLRNISPLVLEQRMVKDEKEIDAIRDASRMSLLTHRIIMDNLRPGVTEIELSGKILGALRAEGAESYIRNRRWDSSLGPDGILASGRNTWQISGQAMTVTGVGLSNALAWGASLKIIDYGDLVVVDLPYNRAGYHADITRTYVVGKATDKHKEVFDKVREIQERVLKLITPGRVCAELYEAARSAAVELDCEAYFQGYGQMQGQYIGHGLGLESDELPTLNPDSRVILKKNMVLAIEPKLIVPGWGAVALEDDILVTNDGYEILPAPERKLFVVT